MVLIRAKNLSSAKRKARIEINSFNKYLKYPQKVCKVVPVKRKITDGTNLRYYEAIVSDKKKKCRR